MSDVLIRDVPDEVIAAIDRQAQRLGLSRSEYLRRALARERRAESSVAVGDLERFTAAFGDLADPEALDGAWR